MVKLCILGKTTFTFDVRGFPKVMHYFLTFRSLNYLSKVVLGSIVRNFSSNFIFKVYLLGHRDREPMGLFLVFVACLNLFSRGACFSKIQTPWLVREKMVQIFSSRSDLEIDNLISEASTTLTNRFYEIDLQTKRSLKKILDLFKLERIDSSAFHGVNGYGHGDIGREKLDNIIASLMGAEAALVRLQLFSGTHAISTALFACLRPGDAMLGVSGHPYDTLEEVIGLRPGSQTGTTKGSLLDWGISYQEIDLLYRNDPATNLKTAIFDLDLIDSILRSNDKIKLIHVQR